MKKILFLFLACFLLASAAQGTDIPEEKIAASTDDAAEATGGSVAVDAAALSSVGKAWWGVRFLTIPIPKDATITSATLSFYAYSTSYDSPIITIYAEDVDDATTFVAEDYNISNRTRTDASVLWDEDDLGIGYSASADIKTVVQEIVNRDNWTEGNDIVFIIKIETGCMYAVRAFDGATGDYALFNCSYTTEEPEGVDKLRKNILSGGILGR